jgi:zinc transport system permease protein
MDGAAPQLTLRDFFEAWELFRDPVLAGVIAGATLGYLGVYIVLRRMVFVSAALSQSAGLGVAAAFYAQIALGATGALGDPLVGAVVLTIATMMLLLRQSGERWMSRESVLGAVYLVGSAGTLLVGTKIQQEAHDIETILFGAAVLVTPEDLQKLEIVGGAALLLQVALGRGFRFVSFDPDGARIRGLPVRSLDVTLFLCIAAAVSVATRVLGALPVFAFSVLPAMAALLVATNVGVALVLAALFGAIAGAGGYVLAFLRTWPVGASEAAVAAALVAAMMIVRFLVDLLYGVGPRRR